MSSRSVVLSLTILFLTFPIAAGCAFGQPIQILDHSIAVQEFTADATESVAVVEGAARNMGNWPIENCTIDVTFYDYQGIKLGTYSELRPRLEAGEVWNFKVQLKGRDAWKVARYTISTACR
jgi:hypothetical protein